MKFTSMSIVPYTELRSIRNYQPLRLKQSNREGGTRVLSNQEYEDEEDEGGKYWWQKGQYK